MGENYCLHCRRKTTTLREELVTTDSGRSGVRGTCADCGSTTFRFVSTKGAERHSAPSSKGSPWNDTLHLSEDHAPDRVWSILLTILLGVALVSVALTVMKAGGYEFGESDYAWSWSSGNSLGTAAVTSIADMFGFAGLALVAWGFILLSEICEEAHS